MKRCFFAIFQQELQNSTMFDGLFSYQYNMWLKSPSAIASDMTPASPNAFENQLQTV